VTDRDHLLELGAAALDAGHWLAAHEHWEQAWRQTGPDDRHAVQALAQLAAALVHLSRGRPRGAARVLAKAQRKLARPATPATLGPIDLASVRRLLDRLSDDLDAGRTPDLAAIRIA
jgi:uncharacterized protein